MEKKFLEPLLTECTKFTKNIAVSYGDKLYDGTEDDVEGFLMYFKYKYPFIKFLKYTVDLTKTDLKGVVKRPTAYWCNLARWNGFQALKENVSWFMFIDGDEIPEGNEVLKWLQVTQLDQNFVYKLANYWYFKHVTFQAQTWEDSILLVHSRYLTEQSVFHDLERDGIIKVANTHQKRKVDSLSGKPMFHHFSWVRGKEGLAKKLSTWAHRDDIFHGVDVKSIVDFIYKNDEVNDCVHNYKYTRVEDIFNIGL
jgi:hypothetical protein